VVGIYVPIVGGLSTIESMGTIAVINAKKNIQNILEQFND
jgi:hypothetical protein